MNEQDIVEIRSKITQSMQRSQPQLLSAQQSHLFTLL
jgi:hypothetical protein